MNFYSIRFFKRGSFINCPLFNHIPLTPKIFTTEDTEKKIKEHRAIPQYPKFLFCLFKTHPTTPQILTTRLHPGTVVPPYRAGRLSQDFWAFSPTPHY